MLYCYLQTGARRDEIFRLVWSDVDFFGKRIRLSWRKNKVGEWRSLRILDENGQRSGGKTATIPLGKRPAFRLECSHHSGENGQYKMRV